MNFTSLIPILQYLSLFYSFTNKIGIFLTLDNKKYLFVKKIENPPLPEHCFSFKNINVFFYKSSLFEFFSLPNLSDYIPLLQSLIYKINNLYEITKNVFTNTLNINNYSFDKYFLYEFLIEQLLTFFKTKPDKINSNINTDTYIQSFKIFNENYPLFDEIDEETKNILTATFKTFNIRLVVPVFLTLFLSYKGKITSKNKYFPLYLFYPFPYSSIFLSIFNTYIYIKFNILFFHYLIKEQYNKISSNTLEIYIPEKLSYKIIIEIPLLYPILYYDTYSKSVKIHKISSSYTIILTNQNNVKILKNNTNIKNEVEDGFRSLSLYLTSIKSK